MLGKFEALWCREAVPSLQRPGKVQDLLTYLLLFSERPNRREQIADALWAESRRPGSLKNLRQTLWQLQRILDRECDARTLLDIDQEWLALAPCPGVRVDVRELEDAYESVREVPSHELDEVQAARLRETVASYRGDLLERSPGEWCILDRERLKSTYLVILDKLLVYSEAHRRWEDGLLYGGLILRYDRAHERTHWRMMRLHYLAGDRTAALRQFEACERALEKELDVRPGEQTLELQEQIRADRSIEDDLRPGVRSRQLRPGRLLSHLRQVKRTLAYTENLLGEDIAEIESTLESRDAH
jgi:DNA-binding SARP family transcriptional activator